MNLLVHTFIARTRRHRRIQLQQLLRLRLRLLLRLRLRLLLRLLLLCVHLALRGRHNARREAVGPRQLDHDCVHVGRVDQIGDHALDVARESQALRAAYGLGDLVARRRGLVPKVDRHVDGVRDHVVPPVGRQVQQVAGPQ